MYIIVLEILVIILGLSLPIVYAMGVKDAKK